MVPSNIDDANVAPASRARLPREKTMYRGIPEPLSTYTEQNERGRTENGTVYRVPVDARQKEVAINMHRESFS